MEQVVVSLAELHAKGLSTRDVGALVKQGSLERLRRGWYASQGTPTEAALALRAGAHLGCLSGCRAHGLWVPKFTGIHAAYGRGALVTAKQGLILHPYQARQPGTDIWPVEDCVAQVIERHDVETTVVVVESALHHEAIGQEQAESMLAATPRGDLRRLLCRARSGSETRVRLFLRRRNVPVRPLVHLPGIGEVDLLVGDRLIVECDSQLFHGSPEAQLTDSIRDLNGHLSGYTKIRLTYGQIWDTWAETRQSLSAVLRRRRHIHRLRPSRATTGPGQAKARSIAQRHLERRRLHSVGWDDNLRDLL